MFVDKIHRREMCSRSIYWEYSCGKWVEGWKFV